MLQQMLRFGLIGVLATLVHMVIGFVLIQSGWQPLNANMVAFCIAFLVSFVGHLGFSFADQNTSLFNALWRFFIVALAGFAVNETLLTILLSLGSLSDTTALFASTSCAAALTFLLSRTWAFRAPKNGSAVSIVSAAEPT